MRWGEVKVAQSRPTLCDPMDCRLLGSSVHGILQARILECLAISFSRGSSQPRSNPGLLHCRQIFYHLSYQGSPTIVLLMWKTCQWSWYWLTFPGVLEVQQSLNRPSRRMTRFNFLWLSNICVCVCITVFYLFIYQWTLVRLPSVGYYK